MLNKVSSLFIPKALIDHDSHGPYVVRNTNSQGRCNVQLQIMVKLLGTLMFWLPLTTRRLNLKMPFLMRMTLKLPQCPPIGALHSEWLVQVI